MWAISRRDRVIATVARSIREDIVFNQQFDFLYRSLRQRLMSFTTVDSCGHWNTLVLDDLRTDVEFNRNAGELHESIVDRVFVPHRPTTDGLGILNVKIDFENSICIDFQLWFFVERGGRLGHSASPSRFSVSRSADDKSVYHASIGFGLRDSAGGFWYPREIPNMVDSTEHPIVMTDGHTFSPKLLVMVHYRTG